MATKRATKTRYCYYQPSTAVDRISKLPDHIIHRILSFLPTVDVVRLSVLAKCWRRIWYSISSLNFSDSDSGFTNRKLFYNFVDECLESHKANMCHNSESAITKFKLDIFYYIRNCARFDKWLSFAVKSNITELDLTMKPKYYYKHKYYCLPGDVLKATSLVNVKLTRVKLEASFAINLPCLKSLSLASVKLSDKVLHDALLGCHSLEKLVLKECFDLVNPQISSSSLKFLEIIRIWKCSKIHIEAVNLHSFLYDGRCSSDIGMIFNLSACSKIRNLSLYLADWLTEQSFEDLIFRLPLLENLILFNCNKLKHFKITSQQLKSFSFESFCASSVEAFEASIDAPNLVSFNYEGRSWFRLSINSQNLRECNIIIHREVYDSDWYINFKDFLSTIKCAKILSLHVHSEKALIFPENLRRESGPPCPNVKHLKIKTYLAFKKKYALRDVLRWVSPSLETLSMQEHSKYSFLPL